ncbi:MAG: hypothetical protein C0P77_005440 [Thermoanaerobacterales bacterium]|nr:hypothetical protein [Thermoanaerobacterales bacterium]
MHVDVSCLVWFLEAVVLPECVVAVLSDLSGIGRRRPRFTTALRSAVVGTPVAAMATAHAWRI